MKRWDKFLDVLANLGIMFLGTSWIARVVSHVSLKEAVPGVLIGIICIALSIIGRQ